MYSCLQWHRSWWSRALARLRSQAGPATNGQTSNASGPGKDVERGTATGRAAAEDFLFPGVIRENWQMADSERIALTGVLGRLRPRGALEIGVYYGGSLSLASQFCERLIAIDIDPAVRDRFPLPANVELLIGSSLELIPQALARFDESGVPLDYVLIDAEHSLEGVRRDIELVLKYRPRHPMIILIHDSGNEDCRAGILASDWNANPHVHFVQCDFVPGQIVEHSVRGTQGEVWGGLALAYLDSRERVGKLTVTQGSATMIRVAHVLAKDLSPLKQYSNSRR